MVRNPADQNREDFTVPTGNHPRHALFQIEGTPFALFISGPSVSLAQVTEASSAATPAIPTRHLTTLGTLTERQVKGLARHLGVRPSTGQNPCPSRTRRRTAASARTLTISTTGCRYDR